jgi:hypothetical protein
VDCGVGRHRLRDTTALGWISGDGGQWNGCGSLTAAERDNQPPSDLPAARIGGDGGDAGRCGRGRSSAPAVFLKAMTGGEEVVGRGATNWQRQRPWVVAEPSEEDGGRGVRAPAAATASERGATKVMGRRTVGG